MIFRKEKYKHFNLIYIKKESDMTDIIEDVDILSMEEPPLAIPQAAEQTIPRIQSFSISMRTLSLNIETLAHMTGILKEPLPLSAKCDILEEDTEN